MSLATRPWNTMDETGTEGSSTDVEEEDEENTLNYIPMKLYGRTNRSRSLPFIRQATLNSALKSAQKKPETPTFKEGLQFLETSHNEIVYKAKKVEYILEKERREARRESLPFSETNKFSRLKTWLTSKINGRKHLRKADESVKKAAETLKTATEMIYQIDDTMTKEEENLCVRAYDLRRASEVTFKTINKLKHQSARRVQSTPDVPKLKKSKFERSWSIDMDSVNDDDTENDSFSSSEIGKKTGK